MATTVYVYLRVSTDEQDIESQFQTVKTWLKEKGITNYQIVKDEGVSGRIPAKERPNFKELLNKITTGDILVVSELTRIGRNLSDVILTLKELTSKGVRIVSVKENLDSTNNEMVFKIMSTLLALFADLEREFIRKRTKEGLEKARIEGKRIGRPPALSREQIITVVELYEKGLSARKIAKILGVSHTTIARTIKRLKKQGIIERTVETKVDKKKLHEVARNG